MKHFEKKRKRKKMPRETRQKITRPLREFISRFNFIVFLCYANSLDAPRTNVIFGGLEKVFFPRELTK
jgi:hypothetical protein